MTNANNGGPSVWHRDHGWAGLESYWKHDDAPDFEALAALYRLDETASLPEEGSENNVYRVTIDGVSVKFTEESWSVKAMGSEARSSARLPPCRAVDAASSVSNEQNSGCTENRHQFQCRTTPSP